MRAVACLRSCSGSRSSSELRLPSASDVDARIGRLGFDAADARTLADHFLAAEQHGKPGHGLTRVDWLETLPGIHPEAKPARILAEPGFERWHGRGALGYLTVAAICE